MDHIEEEDYIEKPLLKYITIYLGIVVIISLSILQWICSWMEINVLE